jgi:hypothetical protein
VHLSFTILSIIDDTGNCRPYTKSMASMVSAMPLLGRVRIRQSIVSHAVFLWLQIFLHLLREVGVKSFAALLPPIPDWYYIHRSKRVLDLLSIWLVVVVLQRPVHRLCVIFVLGWPCGGCIAIRVIFLFSVWISSSK